MTIPNDITTHALDDATWQALQTPIHAAINDGVAPAVALVVYHDDALLLDAAWGWINPDAQQHPVTTDTYFDLASLTKLYTTVSLLSLISQQSISLDTPLVDIVPAFGHVSPRPIGGGQDPHSKEAQSVDVQFAGQTVDPARVTLRHLLTHTSGLPSWHDVYSVAPPPTPPLEPDTVPADERWSRAVDRLCQYDFVAPPDTGVRYSDIGLMLLGEAVARLHGTGASLEDAIYAHIGDAALFRPTTHAIPLQQIVPTEYDATWRKRRVWGDVHDENACGAGGVAGHAGLFATAHAVATFGQRWIDRDFAIDATYYDAATISQARTGAHIHGLGWMMKSPENSSAGDVFSNRSYGHTGFTGTSLWIDPTRQLIVALLTNRVYPGRDKPGIHALRQHVHDALAKAVDA